MKVTLKFVLDCNDSVNASIESNISITPVLSDTYKVVSTPIETTAPGVTITPYVTPVITVTRETELGVKTGWLEENKCPAKMVQVGLSPCQKQPIERMS